MADGRESQDAGGTGASLGDLLLMLKRNVEMSVNVSAPAMVSAFDPATQTATLKVGNLPVEETAAGAELPSPALLLYKVPVSFPRTNLGYVTFPIQAGTTGHVVFSDRSLQQWLNTGVPTDPIAGRTHAMADGVFYPGLQPSAAAIASPIDPAATVLEGPAAFGVKLGATATPGPAGQLALAQALHTYLVGLVGAAIVVPLDGGASMKTSMLAYLAASPFTSFATTKVVAE